MLELAKIAAISILKKMLTAALTEKALCALVVGLLEKLVKSTNTKIDDEFLEEIKKAL